MALSFENQQKIDDALNIIREQYQTYTHQFTCPQSVQDFLELSIGHSECEQFKVLFLTSKHDLIADQIMFTGTIDSAAVYPREIIKRALALNASAVVLSHNHPSGDPLPSKADDVITKRIQDALKLVDIRVIDHIIIGHTNYSYAENGKL